MTTASFKKSGALAILSFIFTGLLLPWMGWASLSIFDLGKDVALNKQALEAARNTNNLVCLMALDFGMDRHKISKYCIIELQE